MENNFYVGNVITKKHKDKLVLYSTDSINYLDLVNDRMYTTDYNSKGYVEKESLVKININDFRDDYHYLDIMKTIVLRKKESYFLLNIRRILWKIIFIFMKYHTGKKRKNM